MSKQIFSALRIIALALAVSFGISYVYAWTAPTVTPPGGNVFAPINTSATAQTKSGGLTVGSITAPQHCIGASCVTSWPTGGTTPPAGSEFLNTSATAQTKAGWLKAVGGNGGDPASRIGVGNNWWMSENTNGNYAIHRNGVGDKLTMDTSGNVGIGTTAPQKKLEIKGDHSSTQARLFSDNYGQGIDGANTAVMSLWASEPGWTWGGVGIGNNINGSPYYGRVTNTRGGSYLRLLDNSISLHTVNSSGADTGGLEVTNGGVTATGAITAAGLTTTNRLTVGEAGGAYSFVTLKDDESPNGIKYIHANSNVVGFLSGYGGWLSYWDNAGNQQNSGAITAASLNTGGTVTASGNIQGQHIKFPGVGGNSGAGADVYSIYQESGPWSYPYPDLRIQYHTGIKYDAYQGYGGHQFYTGWDGSGNPAGLQMQITDKVYVSNDVCTTAGKCLSTAGSGVGVAVYLCPVHADTTYGRYRVWPGSPSACTGQLTTHSTCSSLTYGTANCAFAGHLTP